MANVTPAPGTSQTATKAILAGLLGFIGAFLVTLLQVWTDTDPLTARDIVVAISGGIGSGALNGLVVYNIPNKPKA